MKPELREHQPSFVNVTTKCSEEIKEAVVNWLNVEEADDLITIWLEGENGLGILNFKRYDVPIWNCANGWVIWRIAACDQWPEIISKQIKQVNDNSGSIKYLQNEIKSQCFYNKENPWKKFWYHLLRKMTDWLGK